MTVPHRGKAGGARRGAGRKPSIGVTRSTRRSVPLTPDEAAAHDAARGKTPWADWIRRMARNAIARQIRLRSVPLNNWHSADQPQIAAEKRQKDIAMIKILNLTPHPVTIIRGAHRVEYPACAPADLPRAVESSECPNEMGPGLIGIGDMALSCSASDGQGGYENACSLQSTGLVDFVGYVGVEGLPPVSSSDRMFGLDTFRIVSIVTVLGALAAGRGIEDLLVPMGQVRDAQGRVIGATGLAPASSLLTPLYLAVTANMRRAALTALEERNEARRSLQA